MIIREHDQQRYVLFSGTALTERALDTPLLLYDLELRPVTDRPSVRLQGEEGAPLVSGGALFPVPGSASQFVGLIKQSGKLYRFDLAAESVLLWQNLELSDRAKVG